MSEVTAPDGDSSDLARVRALVDRARRSELDEEGTDYYLAIFSDFECWKPFFSVAKRAIDVADPGRALLLYRQVAHAYLRGMSDSSLAAKTCVEAVQRLDVRFAEVKEKILAAIISPNDWATEAILLESVTDVFSHHEDKVNCLERLCVLYEKKLYCDQKLNEAYQKLLNLAPYNLKALKYFKMVFTQQHDWSEVVAVLEKLLQASTRQSDKFRVAHELAAVLLYQLDRPSRALDVLNNSCKDSPLDTSSVEFDARYRSSDWLACIQILNRLLNKTLNRGEHAVIAYRKALLFENLRDNDSVVRELESALAVSSNFLEPVEKLVSIALEKKDWKAVERLLFELESRVESPNLRVRCNEAVSRLKQGLDHASRGL